MGSQSRRTASGHGASIESMESRIMLAAHGPVSRGTLAEKLGGMLADAYGQYQTIVAGQSAASGKVSGKVSAGLSGGVPAAVKAAAAAAVPALTSSAVQSADPLLQVSSAGVELIAYATSKASGKSLEASVKKLGGTAVQVYGAEVDAVVPVAELSALSKLKTLSRVIPDTYVVNTGSVTSQGDVADRANIARAVTGLNGTGVIVGIISDSFNNPAASYGYTDNESTDIETSDLPANVSVLSEDPVPASDEGRAIAQVVYDSAPGATIEFETGVQSQSTMAGAITALRAAGAKVIIDDVTFLNEPMFEDGVVAQAAAAAVAAGVTYISAAGNNGADAFGTNWSTDETLAANTFSSAAGAPLFYGGSTLNFAPAGSTANDMQSFSLGGQQSIKLSVQWDQPYYSATGGASNADQVDAYVLQNVNGVTTVVGGAANSVTGGTGDPTQVFQFTNPGATGTSATYSLMIVSEAGTAVPGYVKYVDFAGQASGWTYRASSPNNGTIFGHAEAAGVIAVGAVSYANTPAFGVGTPVIEPYSSVGTTPILFDTSGTRLSAAQTRQEPLVSGPDQVSNTFFGTSDIFAGTSAAAASVAGVVALMVQESPSATPAQVASGLETTALGFGSAVPNYVSGYGLIRADSSAAVLVGTVTGTVYQDNNGDGLLSGGEPGIAGATVYVDANNNGKLDAGELSTVTAGNGTYAFTNVPAGSVTVRLVPVAGTVTVTGSATVTAVGGATDAGVNFGVFPTTFNTTSGNVSATLITDRTVTTKIDITVGTASYSVTKSLLNALGFNLGGGNNTLTVSYANGSPIPTGGLVYNGTGTNTTGNVMVLVGSAGNDSVTISGLTTTFDGTTILQSNIGNEIINGNGGNDVFYISTDPFATNLTFNGSTGSDTLNVDSALPFNGSTVTYNAGLSATAANYLNVYAGEYQFTGDPSVTSSNLNVYANTSSTIYFNPGPAGSGINSRKLGAITLAASAILIVGAPDVHADRAVLITNTLSVAATAKVDLTGNDMIVSSGNLSTISGLAAAGFAADTFGGTGITSSTAAGDTTHLTAVGVISNNHSGGALYGAATTLGLFDGIAPALNAVLLKYTWIGDANLDGQVDGSDYSLIDAGYLNHTTGWYDGDFNYDGVVDGTDYSYLDNAYNNQGLRL